MNRGASVVEIVIALAIFAFLASAITVSILGSLAAEGRGLEATRAQLLAQTLMEEARSTADRAWNELDGTLANLTDGNFVAGLTLNGWQDVEGRELIATVDWTGFGGASRQIEHTTVLTNWDSLDWVQGDWSGGPGQALWSAPDRFQSQDGNLDIGPTIKLKALPAEWQLESSVPTSQNLYAVYFNNPEASSFTVGAPETSGPPAELGETILRWRSGAWSRLPPAPDLADVNYYTLHCSGVANCLAAGASGTIIHWNGLSWQAHADTGNQTWRGVQALSSTDGFLVGSSGSIYRQSGAAWNSVASPTNQNLNALSLSSPISGFAVGDAQTTGPPGQRGETIIRWDGISWTRVGPSVVTPNANLYAIHCLSASSCFAAGASGTILRWQGSSWLLEADTGNQTWRGIYLLSAAEGYVVGDGGVIYRYDGASWQPMASPTTQNLRAVTFSSPTAGFAVGDGGVIVRLAGGGYASTGTLTSSAFPLGDESPVQVLAWEEAPPCGSCGVSLELRVAPDVGGSPGAWGSWTPAPLGLVDPALNWREWVAYRVTLTGDGTETPVLDSISINYK